MTLLQSNTNHVCWKISIIFLSLKNPSPSQNGKPGMSCLQKEKYNNLMWYPYYVPIVFPMYKNMKPRDKPAARL